MPSSPPPPGVIRLARWPFLVLPAALLVALWLLDGHQPAAWSEAASAWFSYLRASWPTTWATDRLNAAAGQALGVPLASAALLLTTVTCSLATMLAIGVPPGLSVAVALGVAATRSLWSTVAPGQDAMPVALVAAAVFTLAWPAYPRRAGWTAAGAAVLLSPFAVWLMLPALATRAWSRGGRPLAAVALLSLACLAQLYGLHAAWTLVPCLATGDWRSAIDEVLRPGLSADASAWVAVRQATVVLVGDVHLFGMAVAAVGLAHPTAGSRALRWPTLLALGMACVAVATGILPPALAAALLLPWWAPWFAVGLVALVDLTPAPSRRLALAFALVMAALLPPLRHATVSPGPWRNGMPATADAVASAWRRGAVAIDDAAQARRLHLAGATTVPADSRTLATCIGAGGRVFALGSTIRRVQGLGYAVADRPLRAPLASVLDDLRHDELVALAIAPGGRAWLGAAGLAGLARVGVTRDTAATMAIAALARTGAGGDVRAARDGTAAAWRQGDVVAGHLLLAPVSVSAHPDAVIVDSAPARLATGRVAALAVFDRAQHVVLRGVADAAPGLPIPLTRQGEWSNVVVTGVAECVDAGSDAWTALPATLSRLALPVTGASPRRPAIALIGAEQRPQVTIDGMAIDPMWDASPVTVYDRQSPVDLRRLQDMQQRDAVPVARSLASRWVARVELRPRGVWSPPRALVSPGVTPAGWLVRLSHSGTRADNVQVCGVLAGERVLAGQDAPVDDETVREIVVTTRDGWHQPERVRGAVHQWSAQPTATLAFHLETPRPLVLAMDASGATAPTGRQALTVRVNGHLLTADWPGDARLAVPVGAVRAGGNTLELRVDRIVRPAGELRSLGVLLRRLRLIQSAGA